MSHRARSAPGSLTALVAVALVLVPGCGGTKNSAHPARTTATPARTPEPSVSAGLRYSVELQASGAMLAWGDNSSGELGDGTTTKRATPVPLPGLGPDSGVVQVAAGGSHTLVLKADGRVLAWGHNRSGELGDGSTVDHP